MTNRARHIGTLGRSLCVWSALALVVGGLAPRIGRAQEAYPERPPHLSARTDEAVRRGVQYLVRNQGRNGSWVSSRQNYPCTMTAMAGLALMAAGNTPTEGPYADNVNRAVQYLLRNARPSGLIAAPHMEQRSMYGHGFAMLFLSQAYGMEPNRARQQELRRVLERAIALTARAQSKDGGWFYSPDSQSDEGSVTVTQIQALRACRDAGLYVPREVIDRASEYIAKCQNKDGGISYSLQSRGNSLPAITAAAVATMYSAGEYEHPVSKGALDFTLRTLQSNRGVISGGHGFYTRLYVSQTMWISSEENWTRFFPKDRDTLLKEQKPNGSWDDNSTGEIFSTAVAIMTLQLPYELVPVYLR